jgi:hypothetical protein
MFGMSNYETPTNNWMFIKAKLGNKGFGVRKASIIAEIANRKAHIPGPGKDLKLVEWQNVLPKNSG